MGPHTNREDRSIEKLSVSALLLLVIIIAIAGLLAIPGAQFLPGFARLLEDPRIERGAFSVLSGRSALQGRFQGRDVAVRLQLKRSRHGQGDLVVALRTVADGSLNTAGIESRVRDGEGQRALSTLAAHDLILNVDERWLQARWRPQGFVFFPGRFAEERWRPVLESLRTVAASLDAAT